MLLTELTLRNVYFAWRFVHTIILHAFKIVCMPKPDKIEFNTNMGSWVYVLSSFVLFSVFKLKVSNLGVTNIFQWVGKMTNRESGNNEDWQ